MFRSPSFHLQTEHTNWNSVKNNWGRDEVSFPEHPTLTLRLFAREPGALKVVGCCRVKDPGSPGFSQQAAAARVAAVLPAAEQSKKEELLGFLLAPFHDFLADCLWALDSCLSGLWDLGGSDCWAAWSCRPLGPDSFTVSRASCWEAQWRPFFLDVRLTSDRIFHYNISDLWKQCVRIFPSSLQWDCVSYLLQRICQNKLHCILKKDHLKHMY